MPTGTAPTKKDPRHIQTVCATRRSIGTYIHGVANPIVSDPRGTIGIIERRLGKARNFKGGLAERIVRNRTKKTDDDKSKKQR
ncbi:MAG: hypothetical protein Q8R36_05850 [bacterium]|nr:hypothetical protein [bacterium]